MSEKELNKLIAQRLSYYMSINNTSQKELANYMNVSQVTVSNWCKGAKMPRMDKIDKICSFFSINRSDLMENKSDISVKLSSDETFLIECHRNFDIDSKNRLIEYAKKLQELNAFDSQLLNAAHKRTDIDIPEDTDTSEDDIMDDPNF